MLVCFDIICCFIVKFDYIFIPSEGALSVKFVLPSVFVMMKSVRLIMSIPIRISSAMSLQYASTSHARNPQGRRHR